MAILIICNPVTAASEESVTIISVFKLFQRTPLHTAARGGYKWTVEYLVMKGAVIDIKDKDGVSEAIQLKLLI